MSKQHEIQSATGITTVIDAALRFEKIADDVTGGATPDMVEEFEAARASLRSSIRSARAIIARQGKR